ncbi:hypothetical protein SNE40_016964 [Patella caerulea]|uniref:Uncharacterized protein n=1 Tax=Patella caerulea TaxID=87958 RepID=A0AAN8P8Y5_PATCE
MDDMDSVKLLVVGEKSVGKTSFIRRFVDDKFTLETKSSVCMNYFYRRIDIDEDNELLVHIFDAPGEEEYKFFTSLYYKSVQGIIVMYDANDTSSVEDMQQRIKDIKQKILSDTVIIFVKNKIDVDGKHGAEIMIEKLAIENQITRMSVSCLTGQNVEATIRKVIEEIVNRKRKLREEWQPSNVRDKSEPPKMPKKRTYFKLMIKRILKKL